MVELVGLVGLDLLEIQDGLVPQEEQETLVQLVLKEILASLVGLDLLDKQEPLVHREIQVS